MAQGPKDTMYPNQGKDCNVEDYGGYGEKEPMPGTLSSASDDPQDLSPQQADAKYHGNPMVHAYPDNLQGTAMPTAAGDSGNPSAAEGGSGPEGY